MNVRRTTARAWRAAMVAGAVGIFLSGCQNMFWWRQKPEAVTVADGPSSPRPKRTPAEGPVADTMPLSPVERLETAFAQPVTPKPQPPEALPAPQKFTYPVALAVPGREGFVLSPFNQKIVDVAGFKSGALVADPHYPLSEKKFFRVP